MKYLNTKISITFFCCVFLFGCEKILEPKPEGQIALDELMSTENGILTAVNGIYQPLLIIYKGGDYLRMVELSSDDGWTWTKQVESDIYVIDPTYGAVTNVWSQHYTGITRANTVLSRIGIIDDFTSPDIKEMIEGQAKFLRAYYYFNLVRIFGGVPLILDEIGGREDAEQSRATIEQVYNQIQNDLTEAMEQLPVSYSGGSNMENGRATAYSAAALKAMVHLELEQWQESVESTEEIVGNGTLLSDYSNNFNGTNENESLFEVQYGGVTNETTSNFHHIFSPPEFNGQATILPTDDNLEGKGGGLSTGNSFVQIFEEGDARKDVILATYDLVNFIDPTQPDGSLYYVNKYYNTSDPRGQSTWNYPLIRYAEVLLIRAEALNELEYVPDGEAFELLNIIRMNSDLPSLNSSDLQDQSAFREAVRNERRIELAFEAKRYFDLNRWGVLEDIIQVQMDFLGLNFPGDRLIAHPITGKDYYLYPIPSNEFINNANLGDQNPGY